MASRVIDPKVIENSYDRLALDYHASRLAKTAKNVAFLDGFAEHWPESGKVLDLGCGGGCPITKYFYDRGLEVTGVDISAAMLELAQKEMPNGRFVWSDMATLELPGELFDLIVSFFAIVHVPRARHEELFAKIFGWLRPGGRLFAALGVEDRELESVDDWRGQPMYWSHFDASTNLGMLEKAGFEVRWKEVERRSGDDNFLFVLAGRPGASSGCP